MSSPKSTVTRWQRKRIFKRDDDICQLCGAYTNPDLRGTLEPMAPCLAHVVARSRGGDDSDDNLQTAHVLCNIVQGTSSPDQFAARLKECEPILQAWQRRLAESSLRAEVAGAGLAEEPTVTDPLRRDFPQSEGIENGHVSEAAPS